MIHVARLGAAGIALALITAPIILASPSFAAPAAGLKGVATGESLVVKAHGCHRSCEWGAVGGWFHRHIGPLCRPVACVPRAAYPNRCWVDWRGVRHCRW